MRNIINKTVHKILVFLRLTPLSLAEKCRIAFGAAVVLVLMIALLIPYTWMSQLTKQGYLDVGRCKTETLLWEHFKLKKTDEGSLSPLDSSGAQVKDPAKQQLRWIPFDKDSEAVIGGLEEVHQGLIEELRGDESRYDSFVLREHEGQLYSYYVRIFRANENCVGCHNSQGTGRAFSQNQAVGAAVITSEVRNLNKTVLLNRIWTILAGLIGGTGAIVVFYVITQRVILRPIRQLRALANNVAEGNLDIRSSINTRDEYENLAQAFNHMLDNLQITQQKLYSSNRQLDEKIAELSSRNIELFKANKLKGEFLANISHEFKTPLNAILGFAELLREKPDKLGADKVQRYADNIITGGKRLLNMINDLLNLAKTEAGKMRLHIETISLENLCRTCVAGFSALTKKKKIKVKVVIDEEIPSLTTDAGKVQQILYNFLSNAVKFTDEYGRIEIRAKMQDEKTVRILVSDTGCGVAEDSREKIFEKFRQGDGSITRNSDGTGLGLAICKELASLLAGDIGMDSKVGQGSTFWLDIPVTLSGDKDEQGQSD